MKKKLIFVVILAMALSGCGFRQSRIIQTPDAPYERTPVTDVLEQDSEPEPAYEPPPVFEGEPFPYSDKLYSRGVYVIDAYSGMVMLAINEQEGMMPASTVKIMTALLVLEIIGEGETLDEVGLIEVPQLVWERFNIDEDPNTVGGTMSGLVPLQDTLTYRDVLHALMLPSGNEAANVIAYNLGGGSIERFVDMMNVKASELGLKNTRFANAHGLHEAEHWSCARDLAIIAQYAFEKFYVFREVSIAFEYIMPANGFYRRGYRIRNGNSLVRDTEGNIYFRDFVKGIKNGGLDKVWHWNDETEDWGLYPGIANLVSIGEVNGRLYIIATIEAPWKTGGLLEGENRLHYAHMDHLLIYDWLFTN